MGHVVRRNVVFLKRKFMVGYDFSQWKARCSSLGHLFTGPKSGEKKKAGELSESAKTHLNDIFISKTYGRNREIETRQMMKGTQVEEDSIDLISLVNKRMFIKNTERRENEFISGECDIFFTENVSGLNQGVTIDAKSSWDIYSWFRNYNAQPNKLYYWQGQGYMWLWGAHRHEINHCLVNTPEWLIENAISRLKWECSPASFEEEEARIRKLMNVDDIPAKDRVIIQHVLRDTNSASLIAEKVLKGREYLISLQDSFNKKSLLTILK